MIIIDRGEDRETRFREKCGGAPGTYQKLEIACCSNDTEFGSDACTY